MPDDWALIPEDAQGNPPFTPGQSFRLLFVTSTTRNATSSDIAGYNTFVQERANANATLKPFKGEFRALISTGTVDARDNTATAPAGASHTTGEGVPIFWVAGGNTGVWGSRAFVPRSPKVADDYADFYDGSWDQRYGTSESWDTFNGRRGVWTGSNNDGTRHATAYAGQSMVIRSATQGNAVDNMLAPIQGLPGAAGTVDV